MSDPFSVHPRASEAQQVPGQQAFPETPAPEAKPEPQIAFKSDDAGSDLAGAPEVGIQSASTAPGTRQRASERDKAAQALEVATRRVNSLRDRIAKARGTLAALEADEQSAVKRADYLSQHPALQD